MTSDCVPLILISGHYMNILLVNKSSSSRLFMAYYFKYITDNKICRFVLLSHAVELTRLVSVSVLALHIYTQRYITLAKATAHTFI